MTPPKKRKIWSRISSKGGWGHPFSTPGQETARGRLSKEKKRDDKSSDSWEQALYDLTSSSSKTEEKGCPGRESPVSLHCQLQEGDRNCREKEETRSLGDHKTLSPPSTCSDWLMFSEPANGAEEGERWKDQQACWAPPRGTTSPLTHLWFLQFSFLTLLWHLAMPISQERRPRHRGAEDLGR